MKICVSVGEADLRGAVAALRGAEMAEIRLDLMRLSDAELRKLLARRIEFIATCRPGLIPDAERLRLLRLAADCGAAHVDVELDSSPKFRGEAISAAKRRGASVIISHHDYEGTPDAKELRRIVARARKLGAGIVKIACKARSHTDCARLLGLLDGAKDIVVVGMGKRGLMTRLAAPMLGAPFTYAAPESGKKTEPCQLTISEMRQFYRAIGVMA